jgi:hypothetical protein
LLIAFPQMSLVYKSTAPEVDPSKVKIEIPQEQPQDTAGEADDLQKALGAKK